MAVFELPCSQCKEPYLFFSGNPTSLCGKCYAARAAQLEPKKYPSQTEAVVRSFETGATRSADASRYDPEGFLSPIVIERYCEYMNKHRVQADGTLRASDNWTKGMPLATYIKGLWRHFLHLWTRHRGYTPTDKGAAADIEEDCCAIMFNVMGYLHETLKKGNVK